MLRIRLQGASLYLLHRIAIILGANTDYVLVLGHICQCWFDQENSVLLKVEVRILNESHTLVSLFSLLIFCKNLEEVLSTISIQVIFSKRCTFIKINAFGAIKDNKCE